MVVTYFVYALKHPQTREVRYIGKTSQPEIRMQDHLYEARYSPTRPVNWWIRGLLGQELRPEMEVLATSSNESTINTMEIHLIAYCRSQSDRLLNLTDGGDGVSGHKWSEEQRQHSSKIRVGRPGYRWSEGDKVQQRLYWNRPENVLRQAEGTRRYYDNPDNLKRMTDAVRSASTSPEARERLSRAARTPRRITYTCECGENFTAVRLGSYQYYHKRCPCGRDLPVKEEK